MTTKSACLILYRSNGLLTSEESVFPLKKLCTDAAALKITEGAAAVTGFMGGECSGTGMPALSVTIIRVYAIIRRWQRGYPDAT